MKFKNKKEMLEYCNTYGMYIKSEFFDLKTVEGCIEFITEAEDNYMDKFMYSMGVVPIDYYDEDYYIFYHFRKIPDNIVKQEAFWKQAMKYDWISHINCCNAEFMLENLKEYYKSFSDHEFYDAVDYIIKYKQYFGYIRNCNDYDECEEFDYEEEKYSSIRKYIKENMSDYVYHI